MGLGVAIAALSNHRWLQVPSLSKIGKMVLGIYAVHVIFVDSFRFIDAQTDNFIWEVGYVAAVFILSVIAVTLMARNKRLRKIVM